MHKVMQWQQTWQPWRPTLTTHLDNQFWRPTEKISKSDTLLVETNLGNLDND